MATKTLNTRFQLKYDTLENWQKANPILLAGEVAVATIETAKSASGLTPPAVGIKIGDGETAFNSLNWIQAIAGDVPSWAKESNPETIVNLFDGNIRDAKNELLGEGGTLVTHTIKGAYDAAATVGARIDGLDVTDTAAAADEFVYSVSQTDGKIAVEHKAIDEIVSIDGTYNSTNKLATISTVNNAVDALDKKLSPLITNMAGAMRFRGTVAAAPDKEQPSIPNDNLGAWRPGDVVLFGHAEYVVASLNDSNQPVWELLGTEGIYQEKINFTGTYDPNSNKAVTEDTLTNSISNAKNEVLGNESDTSDFDTVYGAKAAAATAQQTANETADTVGRLKSIAMSGKASDLIQEDGEVLILFSGDATNVM